MNGDLYNLIINKYTLLNVVLDDFIRACEMENGPEKQATIVRVQDYTNHRGLHKTGLELSLLLLGRTPYGC